MSTNASIIKVDSVLNVCQRRCDDLGITVRFDRDASTAYTDGTNIVLPMLSQPVTEKDLTQLYGMVIHECGHHLRPEAFSILNKAKPPEHLGCLFNITEDDGMERDRANEWRGDCVALSRMNAGILDEVGAVWASHFDKSNTEEAQDPAPIASMVLGQLSRLEWDTESSPYISKLIASLPSEVQDVIKSLEEEGWVNRYRNTKTPTDTWDLAVDLCKRLYPNHDQDKYEQIREQGHGNATPDGDGHEGDEDSAESPAMGEASVDDVLNTNGTCISWKDCVLSDHGQEEHKGQGNLGITWEDRVPTGGVSLMPTSKVNVLDMRTYDQHRTPSEWQDYLPSNANNRAFANKIRRYVQAQARTRVTRDKRHGKLDRASITKLALPPIDGGDYNKKIFYEQSARTAKDTAIFVLVDWSGSMLGNKMKYAAEAAQRLVHTFDRVLKIPVALATFSNRHTKCDIGYIKPWNTRGTSEEEIAKRFARCDAITSANNDADSVNWAWKELRKRKESRKLLIVLSDGAPAGSFAGHPSDALKFVTNAIQKDGGVELYGVGIRSNAVKKYYKNWSVVEDPKDINNTLFNLIKDGN